MAYVGMAYVGKAYTVMRTGQQPLLERRRPVEVRHREREERTEPVRRRYIVMALYSYGPA